MNEIPKVFLLVKIGMAMVTVLVTAITIWGLYAIFESVDHEREFVYVVDSRNTLKLALAENANVNRVAEAEAIVTRLHDLLFVLSPDAEFITDNVSKAQSISGSDVKGYCNSLKETGFYNSLVANGVSTEFLCDSVRVMSDGQFEYRAMLYGKTSMVYSEKIIFHQLVTECYLSSCARSEMNPQGFMVEKWRIVQQENIGVVERIAYEPTIKMDTTGKDVEEGD